MSFGTMLGWCPSIVLNTGHTSSDHADIRMNPVKPDVNEEVLTKGYGGGLTSKYMYSSFVQQTEKWLSPFSLDLPQLTFLVNLQCQSDFKSRNPVLSFRYAVYSFEFAQSYFRPNKDLRLIRPLNCLTQSLLYSSICPVLYRPQARGRKGRK